RSRRGDERRGLRRGGRSGRGVRGLGGGGRRVLRIEDNVERLLRLTVVEAHYLVIIDEARLGRLERPRLGGVAIDGDRERGELAAIGAGDDRHLRAGGDQRDGRLALHDLERLLPEVLHLVLRDDDVLLESGVAIRPREADLVIARREIAELLRQRSDLLVVDEELHPRLGAADADAGAALLPRAGERDVELRVLARFDGDGAIGRLIVPLREHLQRVRPGGDLIDDARRRVALLAS